MSAQVPSVPERIAVLSTCWKSIRGEIAHYREQSPESDPTTRRQFAFWDFENAVRFYSGIDANWLDLLKPVAAEHFMGVALLREFIRAETGRGTPTDAEASQAARKLFAAAEEQNLAEAVLRWLEENADRELTQALLASAEAGYQANRPGKPLLNQSVSRNLLQEKTASYRPPSERGGWWTEFAEDAKPEPCVMCGELVTGDEIQGWRCRCGVESPANPDRKELALLVRWAKLGAAGGKFVSGWWAKYVRCKEGGMPDGEPNYWLPIIRDSWGRVEGLPLTQENLFAYLYRTHDVMPNSAATMGLATLAKTLKDDEKQEQGVSQRATKAAENFGAYDASKSQPSTWRELERWAITDENSRRPGSRTEYAVSLHSPKGSVLSRITTYLHVKLKGINVEAVRELRRHYCDAAKLDWSDTEFAPLAEMAAVLMPDSAEKPIGQAPMPPSPAPESKPAPAESSPKVPTSQPPALDDYVTLDKIAALVSRSKRTLEKLKTRKSNPLPDPEVQGTGGRPSEWQYQKLRPWLEDEFGRKLPERFPASRFQDSRADRN